MARIRQYEQQTGVEGAAINVRASDPASSGGEIFGQGLIQTGQMIQHYQDQSQIEDATVKIAQARQQWTEDYIKRQQTSAPGDMSMATSIRNDMSQYFSSMSEQYTSSKARQYINAHGATMTAHFFEEGLKYQQHQAGVKAISDHENRVAADSKTVNLAPQLFDFVQGSLRYDIENGIGSYAYLKNNPRREEFTREAIEKLAWSASMKAAEDPGLRSSVLGVVHATSGAKKLEASTAIDWILKQEGSAYVPVDGTSGAPAKFGINQRANPDVDVKNLTKDQAAEIYKTKYWDAIGGDKLSPGMALAAMNVAVQSGPAVAKKYIEQANGDPLAVVQQHRALLQQLGSKPNNAANLSGWLKRNEELSREVARVEATSPVQIEALNQSQLPSYIKELSPEHQKAVVNQMLGYQHQDDVAARQALKQKMDDDEQYIRLYGQRPSQTLKPADFKNNVLAWQSYDAMLKSADVLSSATKLPMEQGMAQIEALKPKEGDPAFEAKAKIYTSAAHMFSERWKEIGKDPVAAAMNSRFSAGTNPLAPMAVNEPNKWIEQLGVRAPQAKAVQQSWGLTGAVPKILTNDEAKVIGAHFENMPIDQQQNMIGQMTQRFAGDYNTIAGFFGQIAPGKPAVHAVAGLSMNPPNATQGGETRDVTAGFILQGMKAMRPVTGKGMAEEKAVQRQGIPTGDDALRVLAATSGFRSGVSPEFQKALGSQIEVIMAHYVGKQISKGVFDMNLNVLSLSNKNEFVKSVDAVIGRPVEFGSTKVIKPWGMEESAFKDKINAYVTAVTGQKMSGYGLANETNVPGNVYRVIRGGVATNILINLDKPIPSGATGSF